MFHMSAVRQLQFISVEEYLQGEPTSDVKHEYIAGQVYAMAGASWAHNLVAGGLYAKLFSHLAGKPGRPFMGDMQVRLMINRSDIFYYPDVVVTCDPRDKGGHFLRFPKLIIEVLSTSTERLDRGEKMERYLTLPSLEEYVLLAQDRPSAVIYRRRTEWLPEIIEGWDAVIALESVDCSVALSELYADVLENASK